MRQLAAVACLLVVSVAFGQDFSKMTPKQIIAWGERRNAEMEKELAEAKKVLKVMDTLRKVNGKLKGTGMVLETFAQAEARRQAFLKSFSKPLRDSAKICREGAEELRKNRANLKVDPNDPAEVKALKLMSKDIPTCFDNAGNSQDKAADAIEGKTSK
ncbi:MAG: hypothetical protein ISS36_01265 [Candidatus Aenigmarchaeota archaeon]|nr:hypothetical protein [Candidatus Aenigmarchaeota archaeon]